MSPAPLAVLPPQPTLEQVLQWLRRHPHSLIPVVGGGEAGEGGAEGDEAGEACGSGGGESTVGSGCSTVRGRGGGGCGGQGAIGGGGMVLRGVVYRWQLLSCLKHPVLLRTLLLAPSSDGSGDCSGAAAAADGEAGPRPAGAPAAGGGAAEGATAAAAPPADGTADVAVNVAPGAPLEELAPPQRGALFSLLMQGPPNQTPESAAADESALINSYLGPATPPATAGSNSGSGGGGGGGGRGGGAQSWLARLRLRRRAAAAARGGEGAAARPAGEDPGNPRLAAVAKGGSIVGKAAVGASCPQLPLEPFVPYPGTDGADGKGATSSAASGSGGAQEVGEDGSAGPAAAPGLGRRLELSPLFQCFPFELPPGAPLEAAHELMRHLGVHSVLVTARPAARLVGVVTRRTLLAREHSER
jgi:hypothetical protein